MKKFIALFLTLFLLVSMMVGCGKKEEAVSTETTAAVTEATTVAETTTAAVDETEATTEAEEVTTAEPDPLDALATASLVTTGEALAKALSAEGSWIGATLKDVTLTTDLIVEGEFESKGKIARKIAPYTQDDSYNITASFTITAPKMIVKSENTKFQGGTFKGDIYVEAKGFELSMATVEGNIYFADQALMDSAIFDETSVVTGTKAVQ